LAIAIVKDDKVVFAKGYGVRKLGDSAPVNERTIFAIGSTSKAITAAALAMLVDEGKIKWDDPVTKHLKDFQLYDPYATREITVRDLLCHRSGLDRAEMLWYSSTFDRHELVRRLRYQKPSWSLRSHFGYNNLMFLAAGQIIPAVTGRSWDDFVAERIFAPLAMSSSSTSIKALKSFDNLAMPHTKVGDEIQPIAWRSVDNCGPAGSINSSVLDLAQWLRLQLGQGSYEYKKLLSLGAAEEMQRPQMIIPYDTAAALMAPDAKFVSYGLGWFLHDYHGRKLVRHGGNIDGMVAAVGLIPEEKLGVAILSNLDVNDLPAALMHRVFDAYLGLPPEDWSARKLKLSQIQAARDKAATKRTEEARIKNTHPALALGQYANTYQNEFYGEVKVTEQGSKLLFFYNEAYSGELEHWHYDTFQIKWRSRGMPESFATFVLNAQGKVEEMKLQNLGDFKRALQQAPAVK
jgi:CubicO group peptidase (beta-lactamase class C family)